MKKIISALSLMLVATAVWSQARIPVNDQQTNTNKPTNNTTTTTSGTSEFQKYADPNGRFTIGYPGNWKFNEKPDNAIIQITSPKEKDDDNFYQNVNLQISDYSSSIESYVDANLGELKKLVKNYREVSSMYFNRNGNRSYEIVFKGTYGSMTYEMQIKQLYIVANGKAYMLTYASKADERDAFETTANKIFNSFKL
ncbi:MAG: hypothetical protein KGZ74_17830 [Chitinophagaceae bacterium]|nr:hypothetical protein [Chitinophagaceae bacterium]